MTNAETSFVPCEGKITFNDECPFPFTENTKVEGNLVVEGDTKRLGGNIHATGPCNKADCRSSGFHSLVLDGGKFDVQSGGGIGMQAGDTNKANTAGSEVFLRSGDGTSTVGGAGGDMLLFAGDGAGGERSFVKLNLLDLNSCRTHFFDQFHRLKNA